MGCGVGCAGDLVAVGSSGIGVGVGILTAVGCDLAVEMAIGSVDFVVFGCVVALGGSVATTTV